MPPGPPRAPQVLVNYLGEPVTILPRQPGETTYAYRNRRSVTLTGETLYQRRIRTGQSRGLTVTESRGQRPGEYARRARYTQQRYGQTPWQLWRDSQIAWLVSNGFTPQSTGWSWNKLIRIAPRLRFLNEHAAPSGQILPEMIQEANSDEQMGVLPSDWTWERLNEKYIDTVEYLEYNNTTPVRIHWFQDRIPEMPVQWWYYR
jgi:hypothetical protein